MSKYCESLCNAARNGRFHEIKSIIEHLERSYDKYVPIRDRKRVIDAMSGYVNGKTPLMHLCSPSQDKYNYEFLEYFLKKGARFTVNFVSKDGDKDTALTLATVKGQYHYIEMLLKYGADVNHRCTYNKHRNFTPLMIATCKNYLNCMSYLLKYGASPKLTEDRGYKAWDFAKSTGVIHENRARKMLRHYS